MQAQQQIRINAAPLTAALALITALGLGVFGGYLIATVPFTQQLVSQLPVTQQIPASRLTLEQDRICTPDFSTCLEADSSSMTPLAQLPGSPTFDEGRMCTPDFRICREPQNSYD